MHGVLWFGSILLYLLGQKKPNSRTVYFIIICKNDKLENWYHCWRKAVLIGSSVSVTGPSLERRGLRANIHINRSEGDLCSCEVTKAELTNKAQKKF